MRRINEPEAGFSLVEVMTTLVILTLIALVAVPSFTVFRDDARVAEILTTVERLKKACERHRQDTGRWAVEDCRSEAPERRQLSRRPNAADWRGPYLDQPLGTDDNPVGGLVILHANFQGDGATPYSQGFKLTGPNSPPRRGPGQFVSFHGISESLGRLVDETLDQGISGNWQRFGQVQWAASDGGTLMIHLLHP